MQINNCCDLVVDTNVFVHAENTGVDYHASAKTLLKFLLNSEHRLGLDEGFSLDSSKNTSIIASEYLTHVRAGMLAYSLLLVVTSQNRINPIPKKLITQNKQKVKRYVRNKVDRVFLSVAIGTENKALISNDFEDFNHKKRLSLFALFGATIKCSNDILY
jgi:hypothetical protein